MRAHVHSCAYARKHTRTHTRSLPDTHVHVHTHIHTCTRAHTQTHTHPVHTHEGARAHTCTHTSASARAHNTRTQTRFMHVRARTHAHPIHTHLCAHARAHARMLPVRFSPVTITSKGSRRKHSLSRVPRFDALHAAQEYGVRPCAHSWLPGRQVRQRYARLLQAHNPSPPTLSCLHSGHQ